MKWYSLSCKTKNNHGSKKQPRITRIPRIKQELAKPLKDVIAGMPRHTYPRLPSYIIIRDISEIRGVVFLSVGPMKC